MRYLVVSFLALCCISVAVNAENCPEPQGGEIYARGTSEDGKRAIVDAHNTYRQMIMNGEVPGQPRGKDLKMLEYDDQLGNEARVVSDTCKMNHIIATDPRWGWVGQNLFMEMSTAPFGDEQNWAGAIKYFYDEHENYDYDSNASKNGKAVGHYTQVVWHDTEKVGCDFISFYDNSASEFHYVRLYSCNYGPGGNIGGQWPYERA